MSVSILAITRLFINQALLGRYQALFLYNLPDCFMYIYLARLTILKIYRVAIYLYLYYFFIDIDIYIYNKNIYIQADRQIKTYADKKSKSMR